MPLCFAWLRRAVLAIFARWGVMTEVGLTGFECDKSLATKRNLVIIRRKFPDFCHFHLAHNYLGLSFEQHAAGTVAPFGGGVTDIGLMGVECD